MSLKPSEDQATKAGLLRYDGRPHPNFAGWKKSFSNSMSQKYGELAQVFRTGVPFEYPIPKDLSKSVADRLGEEASMKRADYLAELSERRKLVLGQNNTNIQLYSELIGRLHEDTHKKLQASALWTTIETKQDAKGLMEALTKIMTICSSGNLHQDSHKARMIHCVINQGPEESLLDYYTRTTRSLASLTALKQLLDLDINQAMDFTYKLDRKQFGLMITNMDCAEELEMLKHAETLETDPLAVFKTTYPKTLTEAFQRANSHMLGHGKTTTGIVADVRQTVFASDAAPHTEKREKRKLIPKEEWLKMTKEQQDAVKASHAAQKTKTKCAYCSKSGHNESECRALKTVIAELKKENLKKTVAHTTTSREEEGEDEEEDSFSETVYVHTTAATYVHKTESVHTTESVLRTGDNPPSEDLVLCDHCASASIFRNKKLLTNVRPSTPITFTGIGGSIDVTQEGDFGDFGTVAFDERATFNVLSVDSLPTSAKVTYNHSTRCHTIFLKNRTYDFAVPPGKKGMPVRKFPTIEAHVWVNTVAQNEATFSRREVHEAKQASELSRMLAYPSYKDTSEAISSGTLIDCPVTIQSLRRSIDIYGAPVAALKGKTTHTTTIPDKIITISRPTGNDVHLDGDIFFIEGLPFFLTFSSPISLLCVTSLQTRTTACISKALDSHLAIYRAHGFIVNDVLLDSESGLISLKEKYNMRGVQIMYAPPGQHVPVIERKIRLIKERCRAIFCTLPCALSKQLLLTLVKFVISRINILPVLGSRATPHSWHRLSPRELLTGTKTSYTRDLRVGFLDYAELTEPVNESTHNTLKSRTRSGVALYPLGNSKGSVTFMALDTLSEIVREKFHVLPMPDLVIARLNALAANDKKTLSKDPIFLYHGHVIDTMNDDVTEPEDDLFTPVEVDTPLPTEDTLSYPTLEHDSDNRGGDIAEIEESASPSTATDTETQEIEDATSHETQQIGGEDEIRGEDEAITVPAQIKSAPTPKIAFIREPYSLRERKPARTVLTVLNENLTAHSYNFSIKGALRTHGEEALKALLTECSSLLNKSTFHAVSKKTLSESQLKSVIRSTCFIKEKNTPEGVFEKLKARIVAGGDQQDKSIYTIDETSSPTVSTTAVFITVAIAAHQNRHVISMDVETAYLNAKMMDDKPVFMKIDPLITAILSQLDSEFEKYQDGKGSVIVKLDRALYGCVESAVLWYKDLRDTLEADGFEVNPYDLCVFNKDFKGEQITVMFHVDDLMGTCVRTDALEQLYDTLIKKYKKVKVARGTKHAYLGMIMDFSKSGEVSIGTPGFVSDLLKGYGTTTTAVTPADENLFCIRESPPLSACESKKFHSYVAKLLYLSKRTRPDILTLVAFLTTRVQAPTEDDQAKLHRGIKYLTGTANLTLTLRVEGPIRVSAYVDASFATHSADMKSHTGVYVTLGHGAIYCRSSKQKLVTKSSTEAELVGISDALPQVIWVKHFLDAQGHAPHPAHIWEDNLSTICLAKAGRSGSERSRHIQIRFFWIHDYLMSGEVTMEHMDTDHMIADMFTKPLQGSKFKSFRFSCLNEN